MRVQLIIGLLFLFCSGHMANVCEKLVHRLAQQQSLFVQELTRKAVPVTICTDAKVQYEAMLSAYNDISSNCSTVYFNKDRLNIIPNVENTLIEFWSTAFCHDCNDEDWKLFDKQMLDLTDCFNAHKNSVCENCLLLYEIVNKFYTSLDQRKNGQMCFDKQDVMNRTRSQWSKDYKCCKRQFHVTFFLVGVSIVSILPVLFYTTMFALTKRRESNHGIINDDPELEVSRNPLPPPSMATSAQSSTLNRSPVSKGQLFWESNQSESDESSDGENEDVQKLS